MIAAKVAMVDLAVELNLPLNTLVRINKVFKKSLRIQTLLKGQLKMFLFLVLSSSFLCLLFFFSDIRGRHVCYANGYTHIVYTLAPLKVTKQILSHQVLGLDL